MVRILNKIAKPEDDIKKINENFDFIALDMADRSGVFSSTGVVSGLTILSGTTHTIEVNVVDDLNTYLTNKLPVNPRIDIFVDNDLNGDYYYPAGGNLTQANIHGIQVSTWVARTVFNPVTNEKATVFIVIRNDDVDNHTFYIYVDNFYVPAPEQGVASRDQ